MYAIGWSELSEKRRWMAATLACGENAVLSHRSAAAFWGIGEEKSGAIDVSVRRRCELRRPGLRIRGRPSLKAADVLVRDGIPVTTIVRTLVDLASELSALKVERSVNEADKRNLIDPDSLRSALEDYAGNQA